MDPQAFFKKEQAAFLDNWSEAAQAMGAERQPCSCIQISHFSSPTDHQDDIKVDRNQVTNSNVLKWALSGSDHGAHAVCRVLLLPARISSLDDKRRDNAPNSRPVDPFSAKTLRLLAQNLSLHAAGFIRNESLHLVHAGNRTWSEHHAQVTKCSDEDGKTSIYIENLSHRKLWFRLFVTFDPTNCVTTSMLYHLLPPELEVIKERLDDETLHPLSCHPLFVPTLVIELLFREAYLLLCPAFGQAISLYIAANLHAEEQYRNLEEKNLDIEDVSEKSLGNEQKILMLQEKMESGIKISKKLMTWFESLQLAESGNFTQKQKTSFHKAGTIIRDRLEYLIDGFEFQLTRLKRTQGHMRLNRLGLQVRNATVGNKFVAHISEQSRDIAIETKRDSSAMKAIAVLTMFFLPGTFFATFFAMPFFPWSTSTSSSANSPKFWIYWATTIPATALVLSIWRVWYVFDKWRESKGTRSRIHKDLRAWVNSWGSDTRKAEDIEMGTLRNGKEFAMIV